MVPQADLPHLFDWASANRFALFPIPKYCKRPTGIVRSHVTGWSEDRWTWKMWYGGSGGCNFGVACGPSRIIVVDVDSGGAEDLEEWIRRNNLVQMPGTMAVVTPSGGAHHYFRVPDSVDPSTLRQPNISSRVNIRAGHGYVVSPWSVTDPKFDNGVKTYGWYRLTTTVMTAAPQTLLDHCAPDRVDHDPIRRAEDVELGEDGFPADLFACGAVHERLYRALEPLRNAVRGELNIRLNDAAFAVGKIVAEGLLDQGVAEEKLWGAAESVGIPRTEPKARSTIRSGMRAAPRVGRPEPKSALAALIACEVPVAPIPRVELRPARPPSLVPTEPVVERLLYEGEVTLLSGGSGSGKTTLAASLAAASAAGVRDFRFGDAGLLSDVLIQPAAWVFASYEGGQHVGRNAAAWHTGSGCVASHPERCYTLAMTDGPLVGTVKREAVVNEAQARRISDALDEAARACPSLPVVLVVDNVTTAVADCTDATHAQVFMRGMGVLARRGAAVLLLGHPPKGRSSDVFGSHVFFSLADTVAVLDVLRRDDGAWTQWVEFPKHRSSPNGQCLELRSRRLPAPIVELPAEWGRGNERARQRQIRDLHLPWVETIRVRYACDREGVKSGVVERVTAKEAVTMRV